ncbi:4-(cytidine 5'-diphospho)-2-C-methyl-D-erythritol kinase [Falsiphaeobacter marinintestinus]|uniref:4-(cytidine 5'-diphospho)-2-C-methyl-D-erythritol kinase n=1 Tax=Falsiphaeobacter marinintestinus TaxID=1492905 RepID=UPI0011B79800|nr:4-(cytidine 5'-diphospho)-2-C-methyl-D-erythritol kinase [Phaeobacter marinintestinus]
MTIEVFAPAKINLTLHVTGQREDCYHLLDSLVVFADIGDTICVRDAADLSLTLDGPEAASLAVEPDNLVLRAARLLADKGAAIKLTKRLPVASGIGGGSADAAATLRALSRLWSLPIPDLAALLPLGADVPVCLDTAPRRMLGIGDILRPAPPLPDMDILLVNPRVSVPTPSVFTALRQKQNPAMSVNLPRWSGVPDFIAWLKTCRNDLQAPAIALQPVIVETLGMLEATGALHVGMSGSGATCFALFPQDGSAAQAARRVRPDWWRAHGKLL